MSAETYALTPLGAALVEAMPDRKKMAKIRATWRCWKSMASAPMNATWVEVKMRNGKILKAHWAAGGGEEQPAFRGWFVDAGSYMRGIADPVAWRPLK